MHILSPATDHCAFLNQRQEKRKYVAGGPGIEPEISGCRVRLATDTRPSEGSGQMAPEGAVSSKGS